MARDPLERQRPANYPRSYGKTVASDVSLTRRVPVHPARFVVGMDSDDRPLYPSMDRVKGTAVSCASYVGRVDEIGEDGEISVTLWERPNGREGLTTLWVDEHLDGRRPSGGDLLWIWTWIDVCGGSELPTVFVEVETREPTEADRRDLRELIAELRKNEP